MDGHLAYARYCAGPLCLATSDPHSIQYSSRFTDEGANLSGRSLAHPVTEWSCDSNTSIQNHSLQSCHWATEPFLCPYLGIHGDRGTKVHKAGNSSACLLFGLEDGKCSRSESKGRHKSSQTLAESCPGKGRRQRLTPVACRDQQAINKPCAAPHGMS